MTERAQVLPREIAVELHELRTRLAGMANPPREVFLALYDGAEPELFTTIEAARACCDDLAATDAHGLCWDWAVNEFGVHVQFWTHPDDDRPMSATPGTVTPVVVQGDETPLDNARRAAREVLLAETGDERPAWRQVHTVMGGEHPDAIGPVCLDDEHDADDPTAFGCCPEPIIEVESHVIGAYLVELLNADAEGGEPV